MRYTHAARGTVRTIYSVAIVKSAFSDDDREFWQRVDLIFGISLASTILVLLDYPVHGRLNLFFFLSLLRTPEVNVGMVLLTEMWKFLIWPFSRIQQHLEDGMAQKLGLDGWRKSISSFEARGKEGVGHFSC